MELINNAVFQIVGPSGSGKTHFVCKLLQNPKLFKTSLRKYIGIKVQMVKAV